MKKLLCIGTMPFGISTCFQPLECQIIFTPTINEGFDYLHKEMDLPQLVIFKLDNESAEDFTRLRHFMIKYPRLEQIPFVVITNYPSVKLKQLSRKFRVIAHFTTDSTYSPALCARLQDLLSIQEKTRLLRKKNSQAYRSYQKLPIWKRAIDLVGSFLLIVILSPLLVLTALIIKIESKGPVFYVSKRAGQGYKVFDFYKFRSMRTDAEKHLQDLQHQNEYLKKIKLKDEASPAFPNGTLIKDNGFIDEYIFRQQKREQSAGTFIKIKGDPRVTRFGHLIRRSSIDELPQLFNVLKGDMSLVGNRPIPLYEAEKLTSDEYIARFFAPAGITGLWQITKRKKNNLSEKERKTLDIEYALHYNFWMDLKIFWKTLPAALQRENG